MENVILSLADFNCTQNFSVITEKKNWGVPDCKRSCLGFEKQPD